MWETASCIDSPTPGGLFRKKKSRNGCSGFLLTPTSRFKKNLTPLFLSRWLLRFLLRGLLRFRFLCLFLRGGFPLCCFFGWFFCRRLRRRSWRWRFFLGFFADHHQIILLGFDDFFVFARQLLVVIQPNQLFFVLLIFHLSLYLFLIST